MKQESRIYGLDILRAIAILLVIYGHSFQFLGNLIPHCDGVEIFFVLSGYLIGTILLKTLNKPSVSFADIRQFWMRRWLRTLPAYFVVLTTLIIYQVATRENQYFFDYAQYYIFIQSIFRGGADLFHESWSLCIEEWFYLLVPLLLYLSFRFFKIEIKKLVFFWIVFIIVIEIIFRSIVAAQHPTHDGWMEFVREPVSVRIDSIMFGILGAYLNFYKYRIWKNKNGLFIIGLLICIGTKLISLLSSFGWYVMYISLTAQSIGSLLLLPKLSNIKAGKGVLYKSFTFISRISYSMYLLNFTPFDKIIRSKLHVFYFGIVPYNIFEFIAFIIWTIGGAYILFRLVEKPMMDLRYRLPVRVSVAAD
ncbi:acyltransferase [Panacibacter ginsenosidivorans]|uniref:Acyltransferase n=1 Tax=Panacibacter ginsenosidivorans TaxID=1813871 RepID=A0A5B8VC59_9BACT|nr:acyltransferase [Panacibacter ginsenosidivorans]QEC69090.1 acyltransferase [Panacibacter ginsenosidivorans]